MSSKSQPIDIDASSNVLHGYITEAEYARQRGVSVRTCQRDRTLRKAPPYINLGKKVYYRIESVRQWFAAQERRPDQERRATRPSRRR